MPRTSRTIQKLNKHYFVEKEFIDEKENNTSIEDKESSETINQKLNNH